MFMFCFYNPIYFSPNPHLETPYLPLNYKNSLPLAQCWPFKPHIMGGHTVHMNKKLIAIINLTKIIRASGLFPHIFGISIFSLFAGLSIELRSSCLCIKHFYQVSHHPSRWLYIKKMKKKSTSILDRHCETILSIWLIIWKQLQNSKRSGVIAFQGSLLPVMSVPQDLSPLASMVLQSDEHTHKQLKIKII